MSELTELEQKVRDGFDSKFTEWWKAFCKLNINIDESIGKMIFAGGWKSSGRFVQEELKELKIIK